MQSKRQSLIEVVSNTVVGYMGSMIIMNILFDLPAKQDFIVVTIFTIWSLARGYGMRRLFNWLLHRNNDYIKREIQ